MDEERWLVDSLEKRSYHSSRNTIIKCGLEQRLSWMRFIINLRFSIQNTPSSTIATSLQILSNSFVIVPLSSDYSKKN